MYEVNVIGTLNVTQALLPALIASGDGTVVVLSSTAGHSTYEGGGGYVAAKHGAHVLAETLRLEIVGKPVRVIEIAPGMVKTDEFAMTRFRGDEEKAGKVYAGVAEPLTADDVADTDHLGGHPPQPRQHRPPGGPPPRPGLQPKVHRGAVSGCRAQPCRTSGAGRPETVRRACAATAVLTPRIGRTATAGRAPVAAQDAAPAARGSSPGSARTPARVSP